MPYQMQSGKWRAKRMIHGQIKTKVFPTKHEAKKWEAMQDVETWVAESSTTPTACLHEFANAYLDMAQERYAKKTMNEKKLTFKRIYQTILPTTPLREITPAMAQNALRAILSVSGHTANVTRKNIVSAWEWGKKYCGLPEINPFAGIDKFPAHQSPRYVPPEKDFWKVYDAAKDVDRTFLLLLLHTGARVGEVFRLLWDDVDLAGRKIRLGTCKTGHGGMEYDWVSMTTELHNALANHKMRSRRKYVFTNSKTGEPFTGRKRFMPDHCKKADVKYFGFHAIRHLTATILACSGLDIPSIQAVLRHKNPNTTAKYIKSLGVQPDKLDAVFSKRRGAKVVPFTPTNAIGT